MMNTKTLPTIGFIGTGIMGKSMALHILKAGYPVNVFNRSKEKTIPLIEQGAVWHSSPREVAAHSDIIITIIGYPKDVEEVYLGKEGIAPRPLSSTLDLHKIEQAGYKPKNWKQELKTYLESESK